LVRSAQQALNSQGYSAGTVDGIMGPHTEAAIRKFQSAKGLQATGQLDAATIAALGVTQPYSSSTTGMNSSTAERVSSSNSRKSSTD
jgi:peptidoglycan hydrolase-like protein with peptidoglycan-binding domain